MKLRKIAALAVAATLAIGALFVPMSVSAQTTPGEVRFVMPGINPDLPGDPGDDAIRNTAFRLNFGTRNLAGVRAATPSLISPVTFTSLQAVALRGDYYVPSGRTPENHDQHIMIRVMDPAPWRLTVTHNSFGQATAHGLHSAELLLTNAFNATWEADGSRNVPTFAVPQAGVTHQVVNDIPANEEVRFRFSGTLNLFSTNQISVSQYATILTWNLTTAVSS
jgi:hypothetical protein